MKCLSRTEIQEYLDKELKPSQMEKISDHLAKCESCSIVYKQVVTDKALIDNVINCAGNIDESVSIPEFITPIMYRKRTSIYRFIPYIVAASIIGLILLFRTGRVPAIEPIPQAEILLYEFYDGQDLNKMWHEKSQIIIFQDEKGNVIQSIITN